MKIRISRTFRKGLKVYRRLLAYLKPYTGRLLLACACMIGFALLTPLLAYLVQPVFDDIFLAKNTRMLNLIPLCIAAIFLVKGVCDFGQYYLMAFVGQSIVRDLRDNLHDKMQEMSLAFFIRHSTGELISRMNNDVALVQGAVTNAIAGLVKDLFTIVGLVGLVFYLDYVLALMAMVVFPVAAYVLLQFGNKMKRYSRAMLVSLEDITSRLTETISGIRIVKAFGMEDYERERFKLVNEELFRAFMRRFKIRALSSPLMDTLAGVAISAILFYGGYQVIGGVSTPGKFFSFLTALMMLYEPIKRINDAWMTVQEGVAAGERIFSVMDTQPDIMDRPNANALETIKQEISFDHVQFQYEAEPVLHDVSLTVKAGEAVALVGESGAGKSTLLDLVPRFYDVTSGGIRIDGTDIREVTQRSLRGQIAIVTQQVILFDDTVRNNIAYGQPSLPIEEVFAAARAAHAHDFISALPLGYDTVIGEDGIKLSGGERQRIAIARALLKNPPILILDEATSNLDSDSEKAVQKALDKLMQGRTTLVVAHRLSTIRNVDRIYVLARGRIVEYGAHDELLRQGGEFARLYNLQFARDGDTEEAGVQAQTIPV